MKKNKNIDISKMELGKGFWMKKFYSAYIERKPYYNRFSGVFFICLVVSLLASSYSGWSEFRYFQFHAAELGMPVVFGIETYLIAAIIANVLFEVMKSTFLVKFMHELFGPYRQFNFFFAAVATACIALSIYLSMQGIEQRTVEKAPPTPSDIKTAGTDQVFSDLIADVKAQQQALRTKYTYKGKYYMPTKSDPKYYPSQAALDRDNAKRMALEQKLLDLRTEHAEQRRLNLDEHQRNLLEHETALNKGITRGRYNVVFSETIYLICMVYMGYFGFRSARDEAEGLVVPIKPSPTPPDDDHEDDEEEDEVEGSFHPSLNGKVVSLNGRQRPSAAAVGGVKTVLTRYELRTCEAVNCNVQFHVDVLSQPSNNSKKDRKYCSDACSERTQYIRTYKGRGKPPKEAWLTREGYEQYKAERAAINLKTKHV